MTRVNKAAGLTIAALAAASVAAIAYNRLHDRPTEEQKQAIAELEQRIEHNPKLIALLARLAPQGVEHVEGLTFRQVLMLRLRALRGGTLSPDDTGLEVTLEELDRQADLKQL